MLLSASPGGPTANLYSHIAKGDVALNVTLTALNSLISVFSITIIVNFAMASFMQTDQVVPLQFKKVFEVCLVVLGPVSIGMLIRSKASSLAERLSSPVKIISALFLVLVIVMTILKEKAHIVQDFKLVGIPTLLLNVLSMGIGYFVPRLFQLGKAQAIAIGMEIGIHNGTLAIFIALTVIGNSAMSTPAVIYSLIMFFTAALLATW
jgi:BASS family bile acid:Na+ symporter